MGLIQACPTKQVQLEPLAMILGTTVFELTAIDFVAKRNLSLILLIISTTLHLTTGPTIDTGGLGGGAVAGIVIVLLLVVALCVAVVIVLGIIWWRKRSGEEERFY